MTIAPFSPERSSSSIPVAFDAGRAQTLRPLPSRKHAVADRPPDGPDPDHSRTCRSRSALVITEAELRLIAAAATIGLKSQPSFG